MNTYLANYLSYLKGQRGFSPATFRAYETDLISFEQYLKDNYSITFDEVEKNFKKNT